MKEWGEHKQCGSELSLLLLPKLSPSTPIPAHPAAGHPAPSSRSRVSFSSSPSPVRPGHSHLSGKMPVQTSTPGRPRATVGPSGGWVAQEHHELAVSSVLTGDGVTPTGWKLHRLRRCQPPHTWCRLLTTPLQALLLLAGVPNSQSADKGCPIH